MVTKDLNRAAKNANDHEGVNNYVRPFMQILEKTLKWVDYKLSAHEINGIYNPSDTAAIKQTEAKSTGNRNPKPSGKQPKCCICGEAHKNLISCIHCKEYISKWEVQTSPERSVPNLPLHQHDGHST